MSLANILNQNIDEYEEFCDLEYPHIGEMM